MGYTKGEYTANFTTSEVTFTPPGGMGKVGLVSTVGAYLVVKWIDGSGAISSMWQFEGGIETDSLSWGWSAPNGKPPTSFDESMHTAGMTYYEFVTCITGKPNCKFTNR